jgi:hypothetical protein
MIVEYPLLGQPVQIDTNLSKRELEARIHRHCPNDLPHDTPGKRNNFQGHYIVWRRNGNRNGYKVHLLAYDLRTNRLIRHPASETCKDYNHACAIIRQEIERAKAACGAVGSTGKPQPRRQP